LTIGIGCCWHTQQTYSVTPQVRLVSYIQASSIYFRSPSGAKIGSGVYTIKKDKHYVITANHVWEAVSKDVECVSVCHSIDCTCTSVDNIIEASSNDSKDYVVVEISRQLFGTEPIRYNNDLRLPGEEAYLSASPGGRLMLVTKGMLSGFDHEETFLQYVVNIYGFYGSSGGGIFDGNGKFIGIVTNIDLNIDPINATIVPNPQILYATPSTEIDFLFE